MMANNAALRGFTHRPRLVLTAMSQNAAEAATTAAEIDGCRRVIPEPGKLGIVNRR